MALTLESEQRLTRAGLVDFFEKSKTKWKTLAKHSYSFVRTTFPKDAKVRHDDVARALVPILQVKEDLAGYLAKKKLTQKYWIRDFCDLILDRTWKIISA